MENDRNKYINQILEILKQQPCNYTKIIKNNPELYQFILDSTPLLADSIYMMKTKLYWILNNVTDFVECANSKCKKQFTKNMNVLSPIRGYHKKYCCRKCALDATKNDRQQTMIKKYGVANYVQSKYFLCKAKSTMKEKYGITWYTNTDKAKKTNIEKYGVEYGFSSAKIQKKCEQTFKKKYGVKRPAQNSKINKRGRKKYLYNNISFQSSWELAYYIWLTDNNIKFEFQPNRTFSYIVNHHTHYYHPDFYLIDSNQYIEIKGDHFLVNNTLVNPYNNVVNLEKTKCMNMHNVKILTYIDIDTYIKYCANKFNSSKKQWYKQFKIN